MPGPRYPFCQPLARYAVHDDQVVLLLPRSVDASQDLGREGDQRVMNDLRVILLHLPKILRLCKNVRRYPVTPHKLQYQLRSVWALRKPDSLVQAPFEALHFLDARVGRHV